MKTTFRFVILSLLSILLVASVFAQAPVRKGWWKFDDAANLLKAEAGFGSDLGLVGTHLWDQGPEAGNGCVRIGVGSHYKMAHGIAPNGGGSFVNDYTLQIDFLIPALETWYTFFQTNAANSNDGDGFINKQGNIGVAATGYSSYAITTDEWYRLVISVNHGTHYRYYLDGQLLLNGETQEIDGRFALESLLLLFADDDGDDGEIDVAEVAIWDYALSSSQIQALGGFGHQLPVDPTQPVGKWKFDNPDNLLEGYFGKDLALVGTHELVEGPAAANKAARIGVGSYYQMEHGIAPNGGGNYVNEFALQFDFRVAELGPWRAFFQTNISNSNDADCFINDGGKIGVSATDYGAYKVIPAEWYRLIISVKNGEFYRYYLDGQLLLDGAKQDVDGRFGLENLLLLFADNDGEDGELDVAEVAIWDRALPDSEVVKLGGYGHKLSDSTATTKKLVGQWKFDDTANLLKAEPDAGSPLELVGAHQAVSGPAAGNGAVKIGVGSHYKMTHGIAGNGGGVNVNEFSLQFDIKLPHLNAWYCMFQTNLANTDDGDCFVNTGGQIGTAATGYTPYALLPNEWYRLVISVKNGTHYQYYLDGNLVLNATKQSADSRFSLSNQLLVFADNDGEDSELECAELAIWNYPLTGAEVQALGGYGHQTGVTDPNKQPGAIETYDLVQNYPNPFNPSTNIAYTIAQPGEVRLEVFNTLGQKIQTLIHQYQSTGNYSVQFDGTTLASGIYFYQLTVNNVIQTRKMLLSR
ncbi:T9SS type A sorting domain-containing protein [candidate division KSB1 bacterium]|nr:T9SS type A sorting domain-containing protein [candidate division KSB1 bacterium]